MPRFCATTQASPKPLKKRLEVFTGIMARAKDFKIDPSRLHIDPLVEMLCTAEDGINAIVEVMREIKRQYPTIHVTGGASNISFNLPARKFVNQAFLILAMGAGMDSAIINPLHKHMMGLIYATEALLGNDEYCMEYIEGYREGLFGPVKVTSGAKTYFLKRSVNMAKIEEVKANVEKGKRKLVPGLVQEALDEGSSAQQILDVMVDAMGVVGEKFSSGQIFVPEMLMAAKAMGAGVDIIKPLMAGDAGSSLGTCVIGTVQGDLHDIGKNLVCMMIESVGFNMIDLGVDVAP